MRRIIKYILTLGYVLCVLTLTAVPVRADTDGTELHLMEASQLEIQLGPDWSGVEFQLKTDAGLYPGTIAVGEDGILRLEIGGSSSYLLTCLDPENDVETRGISDEKDDMEELMPQESSISGESDVSEEGTQEVLPQTGTEDTEESPAHQDPDTQSNTVAGIPVMHLALFGGGLLLSVGALLAIRVLSRRRDEQDDYDYEDDEDE